MGQALNMLGSPTLLATQNFTVSLKYLGIFECISISRLINNFMSEAKCAHVFRINMIFKINQMKQKGISLYPKAESMTMAPVI